MHAVSDIETAVVLRKYTSLFWGTLYAVLLHFFLVLTGKDKMLKNIPGYFIVYSPALLSIYLYFFVRPVTVNDLVKTDFGWVYVNPTDPGFLWTYFNIFYLILFIIIIIYLLWSWGINSRFVREKKIAKIIISALIINVFLGIITDVILPYKEDLLFPSTGMITAIIPIIGIWYSINKFQLMNISPEKIFLKVMDRIDTGLLIINREGIIKDASKGAAKLMGYTPEQLPGLTINHFFEGIKSPEQLIKKSGFESRLITGDNRKVNILLSSSQLLDRFGEMYGIIVSFRDITNLKEIQDNIKEISNNLEKIVKQRTGKLQKINLQLKNEINRGEVLTKKIRELAYFDQLTGLPNRKYFYNKLNKLINSDQGGQENIVIFFLDLDSFKRINDTLGHDKGDILLQKVAERLRHRLRKNDVVARVGGDEFLILMQNLQDGNTILKVAKDILEIFRKSFKFANQETYITTSIGIAVYPEDGKDAKQLIKSADLAMYQAKEKGKNRFEFSKTLFEKNLSKKIKMKEELCRALNKNEFELYYQPQVNSKEGEIIGLEALIRWNHPEKGLINPGKFIPLAEETNLIIPLGEWVIKNVCRQIKTWHDSGFKDIPVAINLSASHFQKPRLLNQVREILAEMDLSVDDLEIEITEQAVLEEMGNALKVLKEFKTLGVKVAIDDFGIEYSSLNYFSKFPADRVKIAMPFVQGIGINPKDEAVVRSIINIAKNLGLRVIAEGVETEEQLKFLQENNCYDIQGFYYYRPMPVKEIEKLFNK